MESNSAKSGRFKRLESKKSHSWLWDSHISPKNSKWLQENLEEMDVHIKRMIKLIEEDADSFAKKAELYFRKRPELLQLVEEFYRMYRALAERYDNVTGELRKNIPSDIHSQGSGVSDVGSEHPSTIRSSDRKPIHSKKSGPRAAGFDVFLGSGGSDLNSKEGDGSSSQDSDTDSDDSSVNNYSGSEEDQGLRRRINELEIELKEVKEKLRVHEDEVQEGSRRLGDENFELRDKIISYEEELSLAKEKIQGSQQEITELTIELQKYKALVDSDAIPSEDVMRTAREPQESINLEGEGPNKNKIEEELRIAQEKLNDSENKVGSLQEILTGKDLTIENLQDQLISVQKEVPVWKNKLEKEKREVSKLQDRIARYKTSLSERDQEIRGLKESMNNANKSLSEENENLKAEMTKMLKEQAYLDDTIKEIDLRRQSLEEELRRAISGKAEVEAVLGAEIDQMKTDVAEKNEAITKLRHNLVREVNLRNDEVNEMSQHLHELHIEHVKLISGAERAKKFADELVLKVTELEKEVERRENIITEAGEEKREAIRQLCFSIEHYRDRYDSLRQAVTGHRRMLVTAS